MSKKICLLFISILVFSIFILTSCEKTSAPNSEEDNIVVEGTFINHPLLEQFFANREDIVENETKLETEKDEERLLQSSYDQVGKHLGLDLKSITKITLSSPNSHEHLTDNPIELSDFHKAIIIKNLYMLNLDMALGDEHVSASYPVLITMFTENGMYELTYDLNLNAYFFNDLYFYADYEVAELMHYFFKAESALAKIEYFHLLWQSDINTLGANSEPSPVNYNLNYHETDFLINDFDYMQWLAVIAFTASSNEKEFTLLNEYNSSLESIVPIIIIPEVKIVLSDAIYFLDDQYSTVRGIKVGITKADVIEKLGEANLETETVWSYLIRDDLRFHLYFEEDAVKMISLTNPL